MDLADLQVRFKLGVWLLDTEYATPVGDPVIPVCVVGLEFFFWSVNPPIFRPRRGIRMPVSARR
jgi:hypothetical protein